MKAKSNVPRLKLAAAAALMLAAFQNCDVTLSAKVVCSSKSADSAECRETSPEPGKTLGGFSTRSISDLEYVSWGGYPAPGQPSRTSIVIWFDHAARRFVVQKTEDRPSYPMAASESRSGAASDAREAAPATTAALAMPPPPSVDVCRYESTSADYDRLIRALEGARLSRVADEGPADAPSVQLTIRTVFGTSRAYPFAQSGGVRIGDLAISGAGDDALRSLIENFGWWGCPVYTMDR